MANKQWNLRKRKAETDKEDSRGMNWSKVVSRIGNRLPGQDKKAYRESIKKALSQITKVLDRSRYALQASFSQACWLLFVLTTM